MIRIYLRKNSQYETKGIYEAYDISSYAYTPYQYTVAAIKFDDGKTLLIREMKQFYERTEMFSNCDNHREYLHEMFRHVPSYNARDCFKGLYAIEEVK